MMAILYKESGREWWRLGGMTLFERNLRILETAGVEEGFVLLPPGEKLPALSIPRPLRLHSRLRRIAFGERGPIEALRELNFEKDDPFFFLNANLLLDPRVLHALRKQPAPTLIKAGNGRTAPDWRLGWLRPEDRNRDLASLDNSAFLPLNEISSYAPELRGALSPYCEVVNQKKDLTRGWALLVDRSQKRPGDIVEKYLHPYFENRLLKSICDTSITPNQVTLAVILTAFLTTWLFYAGRFYYGWFFSFLVGVLDGVDGKLARTKLMTSKIGKLEHVMDYFYENSWYLAIAANLSKVYGPGAWIAGFGIVGLDTCDNIIGALFAKFTGKTLDEMSPFDRRFRLIGGRRSIYLLILLAGYALENPFLALQVVLSWAGFTVIFHAGRAVYHLISGAGENKS